MEAIKDKIQSNTLPEQDLGGFLKRVNKPDASQDDVARLKKMLSETPVIASVFGNIADRAESKILEQVSSVPLVVESIKVYIKQLKDELGWQDAPMLEKLLIETIVSCWLQYYNSVTQFAVATRQAHYITEGQYLDKKVGFAHKRFLKSIESLAKVRKLNQSTVVNSIPVYDLAAYSNTRNSVME